MWMPLFPVVHQVLRRKRREDAPSQALRRRRSRGSGTRPRATGYQKRSHGGSKEGAVALGSASGPALMGPDGGMILPSAAHVRNPGWRHEPMRLRTGPLRLRHAMTHDPLRLLCILAHYGARELETHVLTATRGRRDDTGPRTCPTRAPSPGPDPGGRAPSDGRRAGGGRRTDSGVPRRRPGRRGPPHGAGPDRGRGATDPPAGGRDLRPLRCLRTSGPCGRVTVRDFGGGGGPGLRQRGRGAPPHLQALLHGLAPCALGGLRGHLQVAPLHGWTVGRAGRAHGQTGRPRPI